NIPEKVRRRGLRAMADRFVELAMSQADPSDTEIGRKALWRLVRSNESDKDRSGSLGTDPARFSLSARLDQVRSLEKDYDQRKAGLFAGVPAEEATHEHVSMARTEPQDDLCGTQAKRVSG